MLPVPLVKASSSGGKVAVVLEFASRKESDALDSAEDMMGFWENEGMVHVSSEDESSYFFRV